MYTHLNDLLTSAIQMGKFLLHLGERDWLRPWTIPGFVASVLHVTFVSEYYARSEN